MIWDVTAMLFLSQHMVNDLISPFSFPGHQTPQLVSHTMLTRWPLASVLWRLWFTAMQRQFSVPARPVWFLVTFNLYVLNKSERKLNLCAFNFQTRCSTVEGGKGACLQTNSWLYHQPLNHQICIFKLVHHLSLYHIGMAGVSVHQTMALISVRVCSESRIAI